MDKKTFFSELERMLELEPGEVSDEYEIRPAEWDSLVVLTAIALVDDNFGITIPNEELNKCATAGALWELVQRRKNASVHDR